MKEASDAILRAEQARYLEALEPARDPLLAAMEAHAASRKEPISDPEVASFLAVTARAIDARFVVELGANIGYGAIVLARAATRAHVHTIEKSAEVGARARAFVKDAGLAERITVEEGDALACLAAITKPIDLLYVDCVKEDYPRYLEVGAPKLSERGVIVADNVLWKGHVASADVPAHEEARTAALRAFNRAIVGHPELRAVILPLGDGVAYAVRMPR
ncbi:MAG: O-methyltransferase [Polyangiaceae bacterium]